MKAEERHELQRNDLADWSKRLGDYAQKHATKLMLVATFILLAIAAWRYRSNQNAANAMAVKGELNAAYGSVRQLELLAVTPLPPEQLAEQRKTLFATTNDALDAVITAGGSTQQLASAWTARGKLFWTMAQLPPVPGAATRPELADPQPADKYLEQAKLAFGKIVTDYPQAQPAVPARFALAAIAETQGKWDDAKTIYEQIKTLPDPMAVNKQLADEHLAVLPQLQKPIYLASPTTAPATLPTPTTLPSAMFPTAPTTEPATKPTAKPATQSMTPRASTPATAPATAPAMRSSAG